MNEETITSLAREYAQPYGLQCNPDNVTDVIRFLLRRYCLVEKDRVKDEYEKAKMDMVSKYHQGSMVVLQVLFPDIAKEVEG